METSFYSWIRKGLGSQINEADNLGAAAGEAKTRPTVQLTTVIKAKGLETKSSNSNGTSQASNVELITRTESKTITLSGPGDVLSLNSNAVARVFPAPGFDAFPKNEYPYIEFWEPDFAWRFTPAKASETEKKLRPWLTLVVCEASKCSFEKTSWGVDLVTFNVENNDDYRKIFPLPTDVWKMAHAQSNEGQNAEVCRILGLKSSMMERGAEYRACLIPVFEIGRLRGLRGPNYDETADQSERSMNNIAAQQSAWEVKLDDQKNRHESPLTFPLYYSWCFKTGDLSFAEKVKSLTCNDAKKDGIDVDVTSLGEGLDYAVLNKRPSRKKINMPAALTTVNSTPETAFPNPSSDEKEVYDHLNSLLSRSPIFEENAKLINNGSSSNKNDEDDPWITPPIYGGKHILATSFDESKNKNTSWLNQVNLDLHYRAAAGLGKKAVQRNQEELVNRAWKQIDAVKMLNAELNQKMLSANVSDSVKYLNYSWAGQKDDKINTEDSANKMVARMMKNLSLMKKTKFGKNKKNAGTSLADVMDAMKIPDAFASVSFQNMTQKVLKNVDDTSVFESIAKGQCYQSNVLPMTNTFNAKNLSSFKERLHPYLLKYLIENTNLKMILEWNANRSVSDCVSVKKLNGLSTFPNGDLNDRSSRLKYLWNGVQTFLNGLYSSQTSNAATYYTNKRLWEVSTYGFTEECNPNFKNNYRDFLPTNVNVYAMDSVVFRDIFCINDSIKENEKPNVVKFNKLYGKSTPFYFIDRDRTPNVSFYRRNIEGYLEQINNVNNANFQGNYNIIDLKAKTGKYQSGEADALFEHATFYMPDYVYVKENFLNAQCKSNYTFNDLEDFYSKMAQRFGGCQNTLLNEWKNLNSVVDDYLKKYSTTVATIPTKVRDSDSNKKIESLKNGLRDDSVYGRLKECADTYYKTFFASADLRKNYLEDCLASKYPIKAYPIFPEPAYYYLKDLADEFIFPGVEELPDDSISMFKGNASFIESYLCGMNTEMGRELLWREYPTDQRGSYFKKFWDSETSIEDIKKENYFDVNSIHRWKGNLGENHVASEMGSKGDLLFFVIKGDLMKLYPDTKITLRKACCSYEKNKSLKFSIMNGVSVENKGVLEPVSQAFVREDVYVVGFRISFKDALGSFQPNSNTNSGYMLVFEKASENVEFEMNSIAPKQNSAAEFAARSVIKTSIVGKHVLTLIGKN